METIVRALRAATLTLTWLALAASPAVAGPSAEKQPLEHWIKALKDVDGSARLEACRELGKLKAEAAPAVPALVEALKDADPEVRAAAAEALGAVGPAAKSAFPALSEALKDEALTASNVPVWYVVGTAMGGLGPEILPDLIAALDQEHPQVVVGACAALHEIGPEAKVAVPRLIRLLEKDDPQTRTGAIYAFMGIGPEARAAVPALIKTLTHEYFHLQYWACRALARIGPGAKAAVPMLVRQLREGFPSVRRHAALALGGIGPDIGQQGLEALVAALNDPLHPVREDAATALGQLGPFAKSAAQALEKAAASEPLGIRVDAAKALWLITGKPDAAVAVLIEKLEDLTVGCKAAEVLVEIGPPAAEAAVPAITKLLESEDAVSRLCAAEALGRIGPAAKSAVPALKGRLEDPDEDVRGAAAQALKQIAPQPAVPEDPR